MKPEDKENVIEFYKTVVWLPSMPKVETLTDKELENLKNTLWFARWMLATSSNKCVNSIKDTIKRLLNGA
jgi:hypothetical protein